MADNLRDNVVGSHWFTGAKFCHLVDCFKIVYFSEKTAHIFMFSYIVVISYINIVISYTGWVTLDAPVYNNVQPKILKNVSIQNIKLKRQ